MKVKLKNTETYNYHELDNHLAVLDGRIFEHAHVLQKDKNVAVVCLKDIDWRKDSHRAVVYAAHAIVSIISGKVAIDNIWLYLYLKYRVFHNSGTIVRFERKWKYTAVSPDELIAETDPHFDFGEMYRAYYKGDTQ